MPAIACSPRQQRDRCEGGESGGESGDPSLQEMLRPPSTARHTPVRKLRFVGGQERTAAATSRGSVSRPTGPRDQLLAKVVGELVDASAVFMNAVSAATGLDGVDSDLQRRDLHRESRVNVTTAPLVAL